MFKERVVDIQRSVSEALRRVEPELEEIDSRLARLGERSNGEGQDISEGRDKLRAERPEIDSAIKRGYLVKANVAQLLVILNLNIADAVNRNVFENVGSPLSPTFWASVLQALPGDLRHVSSQVGKIVADGAEI